MQLILAAKKKTVCNLFYNNTCYPNTNDISTFFSFSFNPVPCSLSGSLSFS